MLIAVVAGITLIVLFYLFEGRQKAPTPPTRAYVTDKGTSVELIDCQRPDYGGAGWIHDCSACVVALRLYLETHPDDPIVGVLPIASTTDGVTDKLGILRAGYGHPARDLVIDEVCQRSDDAECNIQLGKLLRWNHETISWVPIVDASGVHSLIKLRLRYGLSVPPANDPMESGAP